MVARRGEHSLDEAAVGWTEPTSGQQTEVGDARPSLVGRLLQCFSSWRQFLTCTSDGWERIRTLWRVLKLVRFSVLLALVCVLVMLINDQAQDAVRALGEQPFRFATAAFLVTAIACAAVAWWSARVMFYYRFDNPASEPEVMPRVKEFLPRVLGGSALGFSGIATIKSSWAYAGWSWPVVSLWLIGATLLLLAVLFVYITTKRRGWLNAGRPDGLDRLLAAPPWHLAPLALVMVAGFALMPLFAYLPHTIAPYLGTAAIALLAATSLIPVGSLLVYWGNRYELPVVSLVLLWGLINTWLLVENHYVRLHAEMATTAPSLPEAPELQPKPLPDVHTSLEGYLVEWLDDLRAGYADAPVPVVLVATEGGGIRAAYWTALVLTRLHDEAAGREIDFARHTLAISGVSGGSLGAAVYGALASERGAKEGSFTDRATRVLEPDFLSPTVAVMLFADLVQHFFPVAFLNDRSKALEEGFEIAWRDGEGSDRFREPFQNLYADLERPFAVPLLFLNSTVVETGQRLIAAPVPIGSGRFSDALDGRMAIGPSLPLSTAVHNSARFTYVSPAGLLQRRDTIVDPPQHIRLVDGGYFENSGTLTLAELFDLLLAIADSQGIRIAPIVIQISNDPDLGEPSDLASERLFAGQIRAPVDALLATRSGRGVQARKDLRRTVVFAARPDGQVVPSYVHFRLCPETDAPLPLGWTLSEVAESEMQRQIGITGEDANEALQRIAARNRDHLNQIVRILAEPSSPRVIGDGPCPAAAG